MEYLKLCAVALLCARCVKKQEQLAGIILDLIYFLYARIPY